MKPFSFLNTSLIVQGQQMLGWWEGDDAIIAERLNDSAEHVISVDGSMTVFMTNDRSGQIKFKLNQNSRSNLLLTGMITSQENNAFVPAFAQMVNHQGGEFVSGTQGYVLRPAPIQFGLKTVGSEWTIIFERLDIINEGSDSL